MLQWLDYRATLRERKTWISAALLAYATLSIPVVLARPPAHVREVIASWFGDSDPFVLFMYVWIDLAMNKMLTFLPAILGSGVVLRERDIGVLPLLAAKPISMPRYFVLRTISACAVMATLHAGTQLLGAPYFAARVPGFRAGTFLLAMTPHLCAAVFATALCATIAAWVRRRAASAVVAIVVLGGLVGISLVGFYQPAWRSAVLFNPITLGASALAQLRALRPIDLLPPIVALLLLTVVTIAIGAVGVRRMEA